MIINTIEKKEIVINGDYQLISFSMNKLNGVWSAKAIFDAYNANPIIVNVNEENWDTFWGNFNSISSVYELLVDKYKLQTEVPKGIEVTVVNRIVVENRSIDML